MGIKYTVKDNFLNKTEHENLKNIMLGDDFPWFFQQEVTHFTKDKSQFFWSHIFFEHDKGITSSFYKILDPLLKKLKFKALIRIKANLYSRQDKIIEHANHSDFPFKHKGALFALNTCNGFTILKDNTKIKSIANCLLLFDPSQPHRSTTCTDAKVRCNININYF